MFSVVLLLSRFFGIIKTKQKRIIRGECEEGRGASQLPCVHMPPAILSGWVARAFFGVFFTMVFGCFFLALSNQRHSFKTDEAYTILILERAVRAQKISASWGFGVDVGSNFVERVTRTRALKKLKKNISRREGRGGAPMPLHFFLVKFGKTNTQNCSIIEL